jgi:hypothetical protein
MLTVNNRGRRPAFTACGERRSEASRLDLRRASGAIVVRAATKPSVPHESWYPAS